MTAATLIIVCLSVWGLFQLLAVLIGWRFTSIRPRFRAVLQVRDEAITGWQDRDTQDVTAVWSGVDRALAVADQVHEQDFAQWENEFGERAQ